LLISSDIYITEQKTRLVSYLKTELVKLGVLPAFERKIATFEEQNVRRLEQISQNSEWVSEVNQTKSAVSFITELVSIARTLSSDKAAVVLPLLESITRRMQLYKEDLALIFKKGELILSKDESRLLNREVVEQARLSYEKNIQQRKITLSEGSLLFRVIQLKTGRMPKYQHLVLDEAQDFNATELSVLLNSVTKLTQLTVAGDIAQDLRGEGLFPGWEKLRRYLRLGTVTDVSKGEHQGGSSQMVTLTVSHRSTLQIMRLAEYIRGVSNREATGRDGKPPLWYACIHEGTAVQKAIRWLDKVGEKFPGTLIAVVCRDKKEAHFVCSLLEPSFGSAVRVGDSSSFSFDEGIVVTDSVSIKGLEFPQVLIWNPTQAKYPDNNKGRSLLYVGVTRAEDHLALVTWGERNPILPHIYSNYVRVVEEEAS